MSNESLITTSEELKSIVTGESDRLLIEKSLLMRIIKSGLLSAYFDESWYLTEYPDVANAIANGSLSGAWQHFVHLGFFEGRSASRFDESFYMNQYKDVARAVEDGSFPTALAHFEEVGRNEGRRPHAAAGLFDFEFFVSSDASNNTTRDAQHAVQYDLRKPKRLSF